MLNKVKPVILIALALFMILAVSACGVLKPALKGAVYPSIVPAADLYLTDQNGQPFQLSNSRGKVGLVFFGFSHCVSECPTTMAKIRLALETGSITTQDVAVVMVSTDPENDTPASIKEFMGRFHPSFLGLLGTREELAKAWRSYGVVVEDGGETHSSFIYVVDKSSNLRETISPDTTSDDIAADLKVLLAEK